MRIRSLSLALLLVSLIMTVNANAKSSLKIRELDTLQLNSDLSDPQYVIHKVTIKELSSKEVADLNAKDDVNSNIKNTTLSIPYAHTNSITKYNVDTVIQVIEVLDKIIAIGEKIVPLIQDGKAVLNSKNMEAISVIPNVRGGVSALSQVANWSTPVGKHFKVSYKNLYGVEVVSFVYSVSFQYGGTFNGKGKYLTGVRVATRDVKVLWGFDVNAHSELIQISNVGTSTNVIAGATIEMTYSVGNVVNVVSTSESFHVTGDGRMIKLD